MSCISQFKFPWQLFLLMNTRLWSSMIQMHSMFYLSYKVRASVRIEITPLRHSFYKVDQRALQKIQLRCESNYFNLNPWLLPIVTNTEKAKFFISRGPSFQIKPIFTKYITKYKWGQKWGQSNFFQISPSVACDLNYLRM